MHYCEMMKVIRTSEVRNYKEAMQLAKIIQKDMKQYDVVQILRTIVDMKKPK